ncbi:MAG TPA: ATP-binding protein [Candidatus Babeliales bacterium]|nr:ATP-binding protein [Candidatus Babeliales bacterium]
MHLLNRDIHDTILRFAKFPVVGLFGPRQSGKTTLVKNIFKNYVYLNFEHPETLEFAKQDPKAFLEKYENEHGIICDEFQHFPQLLSYIQLEVDTKKRPGYFVLTGSQNFLMNQAISQSLAGRIGILTLLPLSIHECAENKILLPDTNEMIVKGSYPRIYTENFTPDELYPSYIQTYIERDVRLLTNVENLSTFKKFMKLCAGRVGQLLNISDIATNCGITQKTANNWISILEASYIIFLLQPYHGNFNKRITKTPKLYFYDTGVACSLLGIKQSSDLELSPFRGHLFECFIIADLFKQHFNKGTTAPLYFWRDKNGLIEIDCLIDNGGNLTPIEIKSGKTIVADFFTSLEKWNAIAQADPSHGYIIYGGDDAQRRSKGIVIGWQQAGAIINKI